MIRRRLLLVALTIAMLSSPVHGQEAPQAASRTFEKHIRPIFKAHCFQCHGEGDELAGNLDLRLRRFIEQGGVSGPALVAGDRGSSYLYQRLESGEMPPGKTKLSPAEVKLIGDWIESGAKTARPEPERISAHAFTEEERSHWAFQPVVRHDVPHVEQTQRVRSEIDAFLLARLEAEGLGFSPEADKLTLLRRASFDLLGLPPSPEEMELFLADESPDAYERLIDRLLASPHYGERWGRHWLDIAGYADSEGYDEADAIRNDAWHYRDYVIRALNADKPLDQFIREQLAGDELLEPPYQDLDARERELLSATGLLRMAPDGTASREADPTIARNAVVSETIKIVSSALLGLTVGCAECHNHRYDPISQVDYYRLRAVFEPALNPKNWRTPRQRQISLTNSADRKLIKQLEQEAAEIDRQYKRLEKEFIKLAFERELALLPEELRSAVGEAYETPAEKRSAEQKQLLATYPSVNIRGGGPLLLSLNRFEEGRQAQQQLTKLRDQAAAIRARKPAEDFLRAATEVPGEVPVTHLFHRGDSNQPKEPVPPGDLTVLCDSLEDHFPLDDPSLPTTGRRLAFARRLTDGQHPLVPRVLVNRIWLHHFGRGIVATPADFGTQGKPPTHPKLLDWLASELVVGGWRLKPLHKLIMTSSAYRQQSKRIARCENTDPDNELLWRMPVQRLEAEVVRDAILATSGQLSPAMFGPPDEVRVDDSGLIVESALFQRASRRDAARIVVAPLRRSVYLQSRRSTPLPLLATFDAPMMEPNCELRSSSTVTPQSLLLMNGMFVVTQAEQFARRVIAEAGDDIERQMVAAWRLAYTSEPTEDERSAMKAFLVNQQEHFGKTRDVAERASLPPEPAASSDGAKAKAAPAPEAADKDRDPKLQALATLCQVLLSSNKFLYVD